MATDQPTQRIHEQLRWEQALHGILEQTLAGIFLLVPRRMCAEWLRRRIARCSYGCGPAEVLLYKSGRAALRGCLEALRAAAPERKVAYVPDYVCNVVHEACRAAGFTVVEYPTDERFQPVWEALGIRVRQEEAPVVVLCSLFGSMPALAPEAKALEQANPRVFIVADECQNLVPDSPVKARANQAIVFSFNDKTCPGIMGGGLVCPVASGVRSGFRRGAPIRRLLGSVALFRLGVLKSVRTAGHALRLLSGRGRFYARPAALEFSDCLKPHYDLIPEQIYKVSAAHALASLLFLGRYQRLRAENAARLATALRDTPMAVDAGAVRAGAAFLPMPDAGSVTPGGFPAPVKAPYAKPANRKACSRSLYALQVNVPHVRYVARGSAEPRDLAPQRADRQYLDAMTP